MSPVFPYAYPARPVRALPALNVESANSFLSVDRVFAESVAFVRFGGTRCDYGDGESNAALMCLCACGGGVDTRLGGQEVHSHVRIRLYLRPPVTDAVTRGPEREREREPKSSLPGCAAFENAPACRNVFDQPAVSPSTIGL